MPHICVSKLIPNGSDNGFSAWSAPNHYLKQCWNIVYSNLRNEIHWILKRNPYIFIKKVFENVCEMVAKPSRPQCVNSGCFYMTLYPLSCWFFLWTMNLYLRLLTFHKKGALLHEGVSQWRQWLVYLTYSLLWLLMARESKNQGPVSIYDKTPYRKVSWNLEAVRLAVWIIASLQIWEAPPQNCCGGTCQISVRSDYSKYKSRGFGASRRIVYWNGVLGVSSHNIDLAFLEYFLLGTEILKIAVTSLKNC